MGMSQAERAIGALVGVALGLAGAALLTIAVVGWLHLITLILTHN